MEARNALRQLHKSHWPGTHGRFGRTVSEHFLKKERQKQREEARLKKKKTFAVTWQKLRVGDSPVQVSANVILVLSKSPVILCEAEPCSHLEGKTNRSARSTQIFHTHLNAPSQCPGKRTGLSMYKTEYLEVQA